MSRWISWVRPDCLPLAASRLARSAVEPGQHRVLGGHPALAAAPHPGRDPVLHRGRAQDPGPAHRDQHRPGGEHGEVPLERDRPQLVEGPPVGSEGPRIGGLPAVRRLVRRHPCHAPPGGRPRSPAGGPAAGHHSNTLPDHRLVDRPAEGLVRLGGQRIGRHRRPSVGQHQPAHPGGGGHGPGLAAAQVAERSPRRPGCRSPRRAQCRCRGPVPRATSRARCRPSRRASRRGLRRRHSRRVDADGQRWAARGRWPRSCNASSPTVTRYARPELFPGQSRARRRSTSGPGGRAGHRSGPAADRCVADATRRRTRGRSSGRDARGRGRRRRPSSGRQTCWRLAKVPGPASSHSVVVAARTR